MQKNNRTDRMLIIAALAILLLATGLFYFDGWMWGARGRTGERIGVLSSKDGDVRVKFEGDLKWQKVAPGQELIYNDSIYAGDSSEANLQLGQSDMTVSENTLVVLRRDQNVNFMNLSYGNLFGRIAKSDKVVIDTGDGKPIEFNPTTETQITLKKVGKKTELSVRSGVAEVTINGKKTTLKKDTKVVVEEKAPAPVVEKDQPKLEALKPLSGQVFYADDTSKIDFQWKWDSGRKPAAGDQFKLEFSRSAGFESIVAARDVKGQLGAQVTVAESTNLFYRVRGPNGELSQVEKLSFVHLIKPVIEQPRAQTHFEVPSDRDARVEMSFRKPANATVWYQVAADPAFEQVLKNENVTESRATNDFSPGQYFVRAKSDYGDGHETGWTEAVPFVVDRKIERLELEKAQLQNKVLIPNESYPPDLYRASATQVKEYLAKRGVLKNYFPFARDSFDELNLQFGNGTIPQMQSEASWPKDKLRPGRYQFKYQMMKRGLDPSEWSESKSLEIAMEPPRPDGDVLYGDTNARGESEATWGFTPLLFAGSYDVEISHSPDMRAPQQLRFNEARAKAKLTGEIYWRVRARDSDGRIISDFSRPYKMNPAVPVYLAKVPPREPSRAPAATERTEMKADRIREVPLEKTGWWSWLGLGENYVDYRQSDTFVGSVKDTHIRGPSEYLEVGFLGRHGWGGVFTAKETPGTINPTFDDPTKSMDTTSYTWQSFAAEALYRKISPWSLWGTPVIYGLRFGIQEHKLPFVFFDAVDNGEMKTNSLTMASAGVLAEWSRRRWTYYWFMRYQYPLTYSATGASSFQLTPVFTFDGSVGTSYSLTQQLKIGLFWYGQWHQYQFTYVGNDSAQTTNMGFQSLFDSSLDVRLGWDF